MTPEEHINRELAFIKPLLSAWKNSDGSYSILLPKTNFNGWQWWFKHQHGALLGKTDLQKDFKLRKVTETGRGVFLCFELKQHEQSEIIIQTEADMQRFNDMVSAKWHEDHAAVIEDWQRIHAESY